MIEFFVPLKKVPTVTHQQKKVAVIKGKPVFYEPPDLKAARSLFMAHLGQHVPQTPYSGVPLRVVVKWIFSITENSEHYEGEWKITEPDTHNLDKLLFDVMQDLGFWKNDATVSSEIIEKFWGKTSGVYIKIVELGGKGIRESEQKRTIDDLVNKIEKWFVDRGLDIANPRDQMLKLFEEVGELSNGMVLKDDELIEDSIGDVVVVLIGLALQLGFDFEECLRIAYNNIKDRKGMLVDGIWIKEADLEKINY